MKTKNLSTKLHNNHLASLLIRIGLALVFIYAAISAFKQPDAWISFIPGFSTKFIAAKTSLDLVSGFQIILALWLISGKLLKVSALIAAGLLGGIMIFNLNTLLITFRDIGLVFAALALVFLEA